LSPASAELRSDVVRRAEPDHDTPGKNNPGPYRMTETEEGSSNAHIYDRETMFAGAFAVKTT